MLLPASVDDYVSPESPIRVVDAFVDSLDLVDLGFKTRNDFKLLASWLSRVPANVIITNHSGYRIEKILRACKNDLWDGEI
ncbi:MAG: hypothetical protein QNL33_07275, partial [Akkermansiaceae bacterium]